MRYVSTRGGPAIGFEEALLRGLAPDGGLYAPEAWPRLSPADPARPYAQRLAETLAAFGAVEAEAAAARATARFAHPEIAPLRQLGPDLWLLELFHGPTAAFKDLAMQAMAPLLEAALAARGERLLLLTATSGDTGAAAVQAFAGAAGIQLCVLHPEGRISPVQRRQMTTVAADNVLNLAIEGDFDDCQRLVKTLLESPRLRAGALVSSVNSINWGRLAGQIPHYVDHAARAGDNARFVVPTGNFGDAFAGWAARACGAPLGPILAAVNRNDALVAALERGELRRRAAVATPSVSMDVGLPSNLERLVFEAAGRDPAPVRDAFEALAREGAAQLPPELVAALRAEVSARCIKDAPAAAAMRRAWEAFGLVVCPHTAVGLAAHWAAPYPGPSVVLATAHPAKFPETVEAVLGFAPETPASLTEFAERAERCQTLPADAAAVEAAALTLLRRV